MRISDWSSDVCSSDLLAAAPVVTAQGVPVEEDRDAFLEEVREKLAATVKSDGDKSDDRFREALRLAARRTATAWRSEEHTSELQSLMRISYAVFCLKTKKTQYRNA